MSTIFHVAPNGARSTVASPRTAGDATITLADNLGLPAGSKFAAIWRLVTGTWTLLCILDVTGTGTTLTITGTADGTTDRDMVVGDHVLFAPVRGTMVEIHFAINTVEAALLTKADDSAVVHNFGNETIAGIKTYTSTIVGSISGNATTVTNGVVTTGSYLDPVWITGLAGSKITGNIAGNAAGLTANITEAQVTNLIPHLNAKAPLDSPPFTGIPTFGGSTSGTTGLRASATASGTLTLPTGTDILATQGYVGTAIASLVNSAPSTLDTLRELADALGDDPNYATTITSALATKAPLASPSLTGTPTAPTAIPGTNTSQLATTAFVQTAVASAGGGGGGGGGAVSSVFGRVGDVAAEDGDYSVAQVTGAAPTDSPALTGTTTFAGSASGTTGLKAQSVASGILTLPAGTDTLATQGQITGLTSALAAKAPLASPPLTGTPTAPTPGAGDDSTRLATTAWVKLQGYGGGSGTVTSVSITSANGVSGTVDTATTTPAITLTLGAITPASVAATGTVTGSNLSGTNTGDQDLSALAPKASPALTGVPTAPTSAAGTNTTQLATTAFVATAVANLINAAPTALDTLKELADAIGDDANFAGSVTTALAGKQPLDDTLTALAGVTTSADQLIYATGSYVFATTALSVYGRSLIGVVDAATARGTLGLGSSATHASTDYLLAASNLSDLANAATARGNLGLGTSSTHASTDYLLAASNLSDLASAVTARTNLGLGTSATHPVSDFLAAASNLSDLASTATARTNLGLGSSATHPASDFLAAASNLSDLASAPTARTNLGLGTMAVQAASSVAVTGGSLTGVAVGSHSGTIGAPADGATITLDCATYDWHQVTLGGNRIIAFSGDVDGQQIALVLKQDATGSRTITQWPTGVLWSGGTAPNLTTTANKRDVFTFKRLSTGVYLGFVAGPNF